MSVVSVARVDDTKLLLDVLVEVERDYRAHQLTIGGVHVWSALRNQLFGRLAVCKNIWQPHRATQLSVWQRTKRLPMDFLFRNPFLLRKSAPNLVIKWERRQEWNGRLEDVISQPLIDQISADDLIELDILGASSKARHGVVSMSPISLMVRLLRPFFSKRLSNEERSQIAKLERALAKALDMPVPLQDWFARAARDFRIRQMLLQRLFFRWNVKSIFVTVAYGHPEAIAAGRQCGARIIELQHGLIHRSHAGYEFPSLEKVSYRPDVLLLYGDFWRDTVDHYHDTQLIVGGAPYILSHVGGRETGGARDRIVLFLSQSGITEKIMEFAIAFARLPGAPKVMFRLHPNDALDACEAKLAQADLQQDRFELSAGGGGPKTLKLQSSARYQVGVFSTAVVEGFVLGCTSFLIPVTGWSSLSGLLDKGYARMAETPQQLLQFILDAEQLQPDPDRSFPRTGASIFSPWQDRAISRLLCDDVHREGAR